jgi:hypothetical protein
MDTYPNNLAFVELANKSKDMKDVKEADRLIKSGQDAHTVFQQFGIDTHSLTLKIEPTSNVQDVTSTKFAANVPKKEDLLGQGPKGHKDFAEQLSSTNLLI